jgi:hypothetical protein
MINTFTKHIYVALMGAAVLSSCSRPVAYFQRGPVEHYKTTTTENVAVAAPAEIAQPAEAVETASVAVVAPAPVVPVVQAKQAMNQIEAYVRNDNKLATDKKLNKRMDRVKELLATATTKASMAPVTSTSTKKASLMERVATKKIDKQIKNKLSPERTMAKSILTIGIVIAIIGLLLLILNVAPALAGIALVVGLVMIVLDLLNVV